MSRNFVRHGFALLAAVLLSAAASPAGAQWSAEPEAPAPAAVSVSGGAVELFPSVNHYRAILTISRGDAVMTRVFSEGERPSIDRFDSEGNTLADGVYAWQLELIPDAETARSLRIATTENGGETPGAWQLQSGSFAIQGGTFADPDLAEPGEPARYESGGFTAQKSAARSFGGGFGALDSDGSGPSEDESRAASASAFAAAQSSGARLQPAMVTYADGDGNAVAVGLSAETPFTTHSARGATAVPHRSIEPGGANGRPEKEE